MWFLSFCPVMQPFKRKSLKESAIKKFAFFGVRQAKPEKGGKKRSFLKPFVGTRQVTNPARSSVSAAGTECCVVVGQLILRSVHRESAGRVMEPRKRPMQEPTLFQRRKAIS